jgi:TonB family protein
MIKATLILLLVWCVSLLLKKRSAAERHLLWASAIGAAALLPLLSLMVPAWRPEIAARLAASLPGLSSVLPDRSVELNGSSIVHAVGLETDDPVSKALYVVWIGGFLCAVGLLLPGAVALRRMVSGARPVSDGELLATASNVKQLLSVNRSVRLLQSPRASLPITWGFLRPRVLIPSDADGWSESRRFSVLAHEMSHIRRRDWLFQIVAEVACALYWFHPLFWIARNRLHLESERACDDAVLRLGIEGQEYARELLDIARTLKRRRPVWSLAMAGRLHLEARLVAILSPATNHRAATAAAVLAILLPLLVLVLPVAAMRVPAATVDDPQVVSTSEALPRVVRYTMPPLYSDAARRRGVEGIVTVDVRVDSHGRARDLRVVRGLGFGLDENALVAVRSWQFAPGTQPDGVVRLDVEFSLKTAELNELIANDMVTRVGPDVIPPRIVRRVEARYPGIASDPAPSGTVLLDAVIEDDGVPRVLRVVRSLSWEFDEAAIAALEQWRFSPAEKDGEPVKVRMDVEMKFDPVRR